MNQATLHNKFRIVTIFLFILTIVITASSFGIEIYLRADVTTKTMPGGEVVTMWGFAQDSSFGAEDGATSVPGPLLTVPVGDDTLIIHLKNNLTEAKTGVTGGVPVSIMIPGQITDMTPVKWGPSPYPEYEGRVRSLTHETEPGNATPVDYIYNDFRPGTFIYHSATHMQVQVQMGLYGAVKKDFGTGEAYQGQSYDNEAIILFSEIDPALHNAVVTNNYGPGKSMTSTMEYHPEYFLINGQAFSGNPLDPLTSVTLKDPIFINQKVLLRFLNAGLNSHVAHLGKYMNVIAEDGNPYPYMKNQYSTFLPAMKTSDAIWTPDQAGFYPLSDRMLSLTNGPSAQGGMFVILQVHGPNEPPVANQDFYKVFQDTPLIVPAPGVFANDSDANGDPMTPVLVANVTTGTLSLNPDGSLTYIPIPGYVGTVNFTYYATDGALNSNTVPVTIEIVPPYVPPVAGNDTYNTFMDTPLTVTVPGVLGNDTAPSGNPLKAVLAGDVGNGNLLLKQDGSFTYNPNAGFLGVDTFTYYANDGISNSNLTTVTIDVIHLPPPPVAVDDFYAVNMNITLTVPKLTGVLSNDSDPNNAPLTAFLVTGVTHGLVALNLDGSFIYIPAAGYIGPDSFTYKANNGTQFSNVAVVSIKVNAPPVANNDVYSVDQDTSLNVPSWGVLSNDTDPNSDILTAIVADNVTKGNLTLNANGSFIYVPNAGYSGTDTFTYYANDGMLNSNKATVTITVLKANHPPVAMNDQYTMRRNGTLNLVAPGVLVNATDIDGDSLTAVLSGNASHNKFLTLNANGSFSYSPVSNYVGNDSFSYMANDGKANSNVATVTIRITSAGNTAPRAINDSYTMKINTTLTVSAPGVLGNDTDANGDTLMAILSNNVTHGTLQLKANGSFVYTPNPGYTGTDTFRYRANDGSQSNTATVTITVTN